jgi:GMP synthase (glutamine-hydrolysing)
VAHTGDSILILDFGSQYTQLIARRVRELGVYAEILPGNAKFAEIEKFDPTAIILSGSPFSVYADDAPHSADEVFTMGKPILGICYGIQMLAYRMGGEVEKSDKREYGRAEIQIVDKKSKLLKDIPANSFVWMSHGDSLKKLPEGFHLTAKSANAPICGIENEALKIYGIQFHPEVVQTDTLEFCV